MKKLGIITLTFLLLGVSSAAAQDDCQNHERGGGECSVGSEAPTTGDMMNVIRSGSPDRLMATLEHGEMVDCYQCVPALMERALTDGDAEVREYSAWWLRKRSFGAGMAFRFFRLTLADDPDPVRRARAAMAIGEFLDPNGLPLLTDAATADAAASVRASAVTALGRLNHSGGNAILARAMGDADGSVRLAALKSVNIVNFFREFDALVPLLADSDVLIRREAALLSGRFRLTAAVDTLAALLRGDEDASVRRSAAWALGSIGGAEARAALGEANGSETNQQVLDAIEIALLM